MRLIIPFILIALMLPYAATDDTPSGEWRIQPDPAMVAAASRGGDDTPRATTQPATWPATISPPFPALPKSAPPGDGTAGITSGSPT
jgi:hypothetical protein